MRPLPRLIAFGTLITFGLANLPAAPLLSIDGALAAGNGNGNGGGGGNGNGGGNGQGAGGKSGTAGANGKGNAKGASASAAKSLNASHASAVALGHASEKSVVGQLGRYASALADYTAAMNLASTLPEGAEKDAALADAAKALQDAASNLAAAANTTVTQSVVADVNTNMGLPTDNPTTAAIAQATASYQAN